jgi:hypothetical protein
MVVRVRVGLNAVLVTVLVSLRITLSLASHSELLVADAGDRARERPDQLIQSVVGVERVISAGVDGAGHVTPGVVFVARGEVEAATVDHLGLQIAHLQAGGVVGMGVQAPVAAAVGRQQVAGDLAERVIRPILYTASRAMYRVDAIEAASVGVRRGIAPGVGVCFDEVGPAAAGRRSRTL